MRTYSCFTLSSTLALLFITLRCIALHDVVSVDISTVDVPNSETGNTITVTLWFNFTIYQYTLKPNIQGHTFSTTAFNILGPSCRNDSKIMIENNVANALLIDTIALHASSGAWYGINGRCFDDALWSTQWWMKSNPETYPGYLMDEPTCLPFNRDNKSNIWICIDNQQGDCLPYKQIIYFDTMRPNEYINDATWSDGTDVNPEIVTCDPTKAPTLYPSQQPTLYPSQQPNEPIQLTLDPTEATVNPTLPSYIASVYPSERPSVPPTTITILPTKQETIMPSKDHTEIIDGAESMDIIVMLLIFGGVCLCIVVCMVILVVLICFVRKQKRRHSDVDVQQVIGNVEVNNVVPGRVPVDKQDDNVVAASLTAVSDQTNHGGCVAMQLHRENSFIVVKDGEDSDVETETQQ